MYSRYGNISKNEGGGIYLWLDNNRRGICLPMGSVSKWRFHCFNENKLEMRKLYIFHSIIDVHTIANDDDNLSCIKQ